MTPTFQKGTIVCVRNVLDPQGRNPKDRFVVLIVDGNERDEVTFGAAITSTYTLPLSPLMVELPFTANPKGRCKTGLTKLSFAVCDWIVRISPEDMLERKGFVPNPQLNRILELVEAYLQPPDFGVAPPA